MGEMYKAMATVTVGAEKGVQEAGVIDLEKIEAAGAFASNSGFRFASPLSCPCTFGRAVHTLVAHSLSVPRCSFPQPRQNVWM